MVVTTPAGVTILSAPRSETIKSPLLWKARQPPPQKIAAVPVPSVGFKLVVADPARTVTASADVAVVPLTADPVVTASSAGPVAVAGTLTTAPTCVTTVSALPLIFTTVPFGAETVVPDGT